MRRADGCEAWSSEPPGLVPPHRGQALASAGEAAVKDAEGAAQRGMGEPKCAAFWGGRASLMGASSGLVRWENRDEAPVSGGRSEEHTSELQSLMRISYAVFCL